MRRMQRFHWIAAVLAAVLLTVLTHGQRDGVVLQDETVQQPEATVKAPQNPHRNEATLTDATDLYRVCSSRPQRILPTQGSKTERTSGTGSFVRRHVVKPLHSFHDSRRRLETAPFCLSASRDYYVIALRHILR